MWWISSWDGISWWQPINCLLVKFAFSWLTRNIFETFFLGVFLPRPGPCKYQPPANHEAAWRQEPQQQPQEQQAQVGRRQGRPQQHRQEVRQRLLLQHLPQLRRVLLLRVKRRREGRVTPLRRWRHTWRCLGITWWETIKTKTPSSTLPPPARSDRRRLQRTLFSVSDFLGSRWKKIFTRWRKKIETFSSLLKKFVSMSNKKVLLLTVVTRFDAS